MAAYGAHPLFWPGYPYLAVRGHQRDFHMLGITPETLVA